MANVQNHADRFPAGVWKVELLETADWTRRCGRFDDFRGNVEFPAGGFVERFERLARDGGVDGVVRLVLVVVHNHGNVMRMMASRDGVNLDIIRGMCTKNLLMWAIRSYNHGNTILDDPRFLSSNVGNGVS